MTCNLCHMVDRREHASHKAELRNTNPLGTTALRQNFSSLKQYSIISLDLFLLLFFNYKILYLDIPMQVITTISINV